MIEILILINLSKSIAAKAREKGRSGTPFVFLLLALWIGGEVFAAIVAGVLSMVVMGDDEPNLLLVYPAAIAGAVIGAVIAFQIVKAIAPARSHDDYDDDYERDDRRDRNERDRY